MINAGLPLSRSLEVLERQSSNPKLTLILTDIKNQINSGSTLSQALSSYQEIFPPVFTAMIAAGEQSGDLAGSLTGLSDQMTKTQELRQKVKGAMIYPAIIILAVILVGILMMTFLLPTLAETFRDLDTELPLSTRTLIGFSDLILAYGLWFLFGFVAFTLVFWRLLKLNQSKILFDALILRLPAFGELIKKVNSAIIMRTIASLVTSGVSMVEALKITSKVTGNYSYQEFINQPIERIQKGVALSVIFSEQEDLFPVLVGEMTAVGEETGKLSEMMIKGSEFFENEIDQITKNLSTIIEPVLMILIGLAVGFFAVSLISPIYSLTDAL